MATQMFSTSIPFHVRCGLKVAQAVAEHVKGHLTAPMKISANVNRPEHDPRPAEDYGTAHVMIHFEHGIKVLVVLISSFNEGAESWSVQEVEVKRRTARGGTKRKIWNGDREVEKLAPLWGEDSVPVWR